MSKPKIIIPNNIITSKYRILRPTASSDTLEDSTQLKMFNNSEAEYILTINSENKDLQSLETCSGLFNYLNISGSLTMNVKNVGTFRIYNYITKHARLSKWSGSDYHKSKKITINSDNGVFFGIHGYDEPDAQLPLEELNINSRHNSVDLSNIGNLKSIVLFNPEPPIPEENTRYTNTESLKVTNCPSLEKIDMSCMYFVSPDTFYLRKIPADCQLIMNPELTLYGMLKSPCDCFDMKYMVSEHYYSTSDLSRNFVKLKDLFNIPKDQKTFTVSYKDFQKRIFDYGNEKIKEFWVEMLKQENEKMFGQKQKDKKDNHLCQR